MSDLRAMARQAARDHVNASLVESLIDRAIIHTIADAVALAVLKEVSAAIQARAQDGENSYRVAERDGILAMIVVEQQSFSVVAASEEHEKKDDRASLLPADPISEVTTEALPNFPVFYLAQLRHAYQQLMRGEVKNQHAFARGLIGPAIEAFEKYQIGSGNQASREQGRE